MSHPTLTDAETATAVSALDVLQFGGGFIAARSRVSPMSALLWGAGFEFLRAKEDKSGRAKALQGLMLYLIGYSLAVATSPLPLVGDPAHITQ